MVDTFNWKIELMEGGIMGMGTFGFKTNVMVAKESDSFKDRAQRTVPYLTVPSIAKEIERVQKLGAAVHKEPQKIPGMGEWAYIKVPGDVVVGLWSNAPEWKPPPRVETKGKYDEFTMNFFEIATATPKETSEFLKQAYNWDLGFSEDYHGQNYWYWHGDGSSFSLGVRGLKKGETGTVFHGHVNLLQSYSDVLAKSKKNGAKTVGGKVDHAPHGHAQYIAMPGNTLIGLWEGVAQDKQQGQEPKAAKEKKEVKMDVEQAPNERPKRSAKSAAMEKLNSSSESLKRSRGDSDAGDAPKTAATTKRATKKAKKDDE